MNTNITPPHAPLSHPQYRPDIDGLRAVAILAVVAFHAFPNWVNGGFIGVDIFFVISGFLISTIIMGSLERDSFSFVDFYKRRIRRIFPALALVLAACFAFGWFVLLPDEYMQLGKHIASGAGFVSNFALWSESGYFDNAADTKPLLHLWSLGIEEQFYIVWPLLLWSACKLRLNLLALALAIALISFALGAYDVRSDAVAAFYSPQSRFWELLVGSVLAYMALHKNLLFNNFRNNVDAGPGQAILAQTPEANGAMLRNFLSVLGALFIAKGMLVIARGMEFPGWWALLPVLGAALIIAAGPHAWINRVILSNRLMVWFGLVSFPLYLWHWPLLSFAHIVEGKTPSDAIRLAAVLIAIALAWLTYWLVEKPVRSGTHSNAKTAALAGLMFVVGYAGYDVYSREGLAFRLPKLIAQLTEYEYDYQKAFRQGTCFLTPDQNYPAFSACESLEKGGDEKPTIYLWGDSQAAQLFAGYKDAFGEKYKIIQRTAAACPPFINPEIKGLPHCKEVNEYILKSIASKKPAKVVLSVSWTTNKDWRKIEETVIQLHNIGITDIDLIGPIPQWSAPLPRELWLYSMQNKLSLFSVPYRMNFGLNNNFMELDPQLHDFAQKIHVNYISPSKIMCNELGCITRLGDTTDTLTSYSRDHLTEAGARYLVSHFPMK
jgi:peptidoglycan/LPS O-acetylase OafA/YrhL